MNESEEDFIVVNYDKCAKPKAEKGADFIVSKCSDYRYVIIELKGRNFEDAYKQIEATYKAVSGCKLCSGAGAGAIVSARSPAVGSDFQVKVSRWHQSGGIRVKFYTLKLERKFDDLF